RTCRHPFLTFCANNGLSCARKSSAWGDGACVLRGRLGTRLATEVKPSVIARSCVPTPSQHCRVFFRCTVKDLRRTVTADSYMNPGLHAFVQLGAILFDVG